MDLYSAYKVLNRDLLNVANSINRLKITEQPAKIDMLRLRENPFVLTEESVRTQRTVMTAHDINQYKNQISTIMAREDIHSWLEYLLSLKL